MTTALAANLFQRDLNFALSSGSHSPSVNASPSPRPASGSVLRLNIPTENGYFGDAVYESSVEEEDPELSLRRIPRRTSADHGLHWNPESDRFILRRESYESYDSSFPSPSQSVSSLSSTYTSYDPSTLIYDRIIDSLTAAKPNPFMFTGPRNLLLFDPSQDENFKYEYIPPLMIKRLKNTSPETQILYSAHIPPLRADPWNAVPHIVGVVERGEWVYMCMKQLSEYNKPPLVTVEHYIDFFRQVLERLTFLHEHGISGLCLSDPSSYMVDISSAPPTPSDRISDAIPLPEQFDRFKYPVHYYFVNFSKATRLSRQSLHPSPTPTDSTFEKASPMTQDVRECGMMFEKLLANVPQIAKTFDPLIDVMDKGHFTIKQFENLLATMDPSLFETTAIQPSTPDGKYTDMARHNSEAVLESQQMGNNSRDRSLSH